MTAKAPTEAQEQRCVVDHVHSTYPTVLVTCTGAGLGFNARFQKSMNALGYLPGTPDLIFFEPRNGHHGLMIEMKSVTGDIRPHQTAMMHQLRERGYRAHICFGAKQAIEIIDDYFGAKI